jgi:hypothetical protein
MRRCVTQVEQNTLARPRYLVNPKLSRLGLLTDPLGPVHA